MSRKRLPVRRQNELAALDTDLPLLKLMKLDRSPNSEVSVLNVAPQPETADPQRVSVAESFVEPSASAHLILQPEQSSTSA